MSASVFTDGAPRTPGEAIAWARAVLRPGLAVVVGIAIPAGGSTAANSNAVLDIAVLDTDGRLRTQHRIDRAAGWAFAALRSVASSRLLLAYNAANVREWLAHDAIRVGIGIGDVADPRHWDCIMRARSAAAGRPDRAYPLGIATDAVSAARLSLRVIKDIAGGGGGLRPEPCRPVPGRSIGGSGRGGQGERGWRSERGRRAVTVGWPNPGPPGDRFRPGPWSGD